MAFARLRGAARGLEAHVVQGRLIWRTEPTLIRRLIAEHGGAGTRPRRRRLLTVWRAARHARVPIRTVHSWIESGKLKSYRLGAGRVRIDEVELDKFLASRPSPGKLLFSIKNGQVFSQGAVPRQPAGLTLFSVRSAAEYAGVSIGTVRRWIKAGHLKAYRTGREVGVDEFDLIRYLFSRKN